MIGFIRVIKVVRMAAITISWCSVVDSSDMTLYAVQADMRSSQRKACRAVVEGSIVPVRRIMTLLAGRGIATRDMIHRGIVIALMAGNTLGGFAAVWSAVMTLHTIQ